MKKNILFLLYLILAASSITLYAQEKIVKLYDSANYYYQKKDFKKSAHFYDVYYLEQKNGDSNYDTYRAAVASAQIGNFEHASYYIKRSGEIYYDYSGFYEFPSYDQFVNDPIHNKLKDLPEWKHFIQVLKFKADSAEVSNSKIMAALSDTSNRANHSLLNQQGFWKRESAKLTATQLAEKIKQFQKFPKVGKTGYWTLYNIKANDTLTVPFMVYIPDNYRPDKKTPLYVYLHGAIVGRTAFSNPAWIEKGNEVKIMDAAKAQNAFVIYPFGKKDFGWIYQQQAFETILREINMVKSLYNINDNEVYVAGHSNGGSGAFWLAANQPNPFAAFVGFNYLPKVYGSNTSFRNLNNAAPFFGISGLQDNTFPYSTVNAIYEHGKSTGANWQNYAKKGNHGLAIEHRDSIKFIFDTLQRTRRNPFPKKLQWETDDIRNGRISWLAITELDTLAQPADWQVPLNPTLTQNGKTAVVDFNKHKSGAVMATTNGNAIDIKTSRVKRLRIYLFTDQFDLDKQIRITLNGKHFLNVKVNADKNILLSEFLKNMDRTFLVSNILELTVE